MSIPRGRIPKKSNRGFIITVSVMLLVGIGVIAYLVKRPKPAATTMLSTNEPLPDAKGYTMGSDTAPVEIVMFGDFECPFCGQFALLTEPDVRKHLVATGRARYRFMDFPMPSIHPSTLFAHNAAACAGAQNKFWEMHDSLYAGQREWSQLANHKDMNAPKVMKRFAQEIGLDMPAFDSCFDARQFEPQLKANQRYGATLNFAGIPTILVGKRMVTNPPYDVIKALVDSASAEAPHTTPVAKPAAKPAAAVGGSGKKGK